MAQFAHWRSPRGLDFHVAGPLVRLRAYDGSGTADFRRTDGRVTQAYGCLSGLRGRKLRRVVRRKDEGAYFLTDALEDYLVDVRWLKAYLHGFGERSGSGEIRLRWTDGAVQERSWGADADARLKGEDGHGVRVVCEYPNVVVETDRLHLRTESWETWERLRERKVEERTTELRLTLVNDGPRPRAVQPFRLGLVDGHSLPCLMPSLPGPVSADDADVCLVGGDVSIASWNPLGQSVLLGPGKRIAITLRNGRTPAPKTPVLAWRQGRLRYADGTVTFAIRRVGVPYVDTTVPNEVPG